MAPITLWLRIACVGIKNRPFVLVAEKESFRAGDGNSQCAGSCLQLQVGRRAPERGSNIIPGDQKIQFLV